MTNMKKHLILQSGFITPEVDGVVLPKANQPSLADAIIQPYKQQTMQYHYSVLIDQLYDRYMFDSKLVQDFQFREDFIKAFMQLIEGISFKSWVYIQHESTRLTNSGVQFLLDTLQYIATGQRSVSIDNWVGLIQVSESPQTQPDLLNTLMCWFGDRSDSNVSTGRIPNTVTEVLSQWLSYETGFKDFILTVGIIFGEHQRMSVSNR